MIVRQRIPLVTGGVPGTCASTTASDPRRTGAEILSQPLGFYQTEFSALSALLMFLWGFDSLEGTRRRLSSN